MARIIWIVPNLALLGAGLLSGLKSGVYKDMEQLKDFCQKSKNRVEPDLENLSAVKAYEGWQSLIAHMG